MTGGSVIRTSRLPLLVALALALLLAAGGGAAADSHVTAAEVDAVVERILDLPYDPGYTPTGTDSAFDGDDYPAAFPLTDTSSGTCCTGPVPDQQPLADLAPPFAAFPEEFELVELESYDGTPLHAFVSIVPGAPGVVVMHGFNTNGKYSIVRYAAFLRANGFSVIAPDHRDMGREWERGGSWHPSGTRRGQSIGWKESEDLLVAAEELRRRGAERIGVLGFSEGAQNTILALGRDHDGLVDTALTFSGPADQATQATREDAATAALLTTVVNNPDICDYLTTVGQLEEFRATPNFMFRQDSAVDALDGIIGSGVDVPALHFYAQDDTLVPPYHATILASRTLQMPTQRTVLVEAGNHAYFYDRWWTQAAALEWFRTWLDPDGDDTTAEPTVAQPATGTPLHEQTVDLSGTTREQGDAERRSQDVCAAVDDPVGPTALLVAEGDGDTWHLDGRRSYSGWDDHELVSWSLDSGDGSQASGADVLDATLSHTYGEPGTYEATLTVTDDTGRQATTTHTIEVAGAPSDDGGAEGGTSGDGGTLPDTGGGAAAIGLAALLVASRLQGGPARRRRR